ncbi:beta-ketoacyl synthase chain length factor [Variovorax saccharolyticus]|uniref:beta-ketoacyl synthase chain length factor n=1 Tax=Variovorax saccharolyticus TaxID=3053516 RepID=UPI00257605FF|nr:MULTISPECIES: beta-ketoacyl synthase chain length factor [unclassified Variovorax]MDM0017195.1 beta-ketoacyl synthase chain length factor [Variovorax sp. J22R187]MDM0030231.1 beta-ketoacyl synthase chain length factor [Variovorax sp. J31P216]
MSAAKTPTLYIEGPAFWAATLPGWEIASAVFRGEGAPADPPAKRPSPQLLAPAERRRAPDTVALALEVAAAAVAASGRNAADLPCVFASAHGDLGINDYMCGTLATDPLLLSPIKFHNSVHNAAVGYWTIGTGCMAASNSLAAYESSFASGLLEAAAQCAADQRAVLLAGYDMPAVGALASVTTSREMLAVALVLSPTRTARTVASFEWTLAAGAAPATRARSAAARALEVNAMADALPLFEALARAEPESLSLPLSATLSLQLQLQPELQLETQS